MHGPPYFYVQEDRRLVNARVLGPQGLRQGDPLEDSRLYISIMGALPSMNVAELRMAHEALSLILQSREPYRVDVPQNVLPFRRPSPAATTKQRHRDEARE